MAAVELILYTGPHCSLCKKAEELLYNQGISAFARVDVTSSLELKKNYGLKIPVLCRTDLQQALYWPFDEQQLISYLQQPAD